MATLHIRDLKDSTKNGLRVRAARKGHSMEKEAREILDQALETDVESKSFWVAIRPLVEKHGGWEFELPDRPADREPPDFSSWPEE